MVPRAVSVTVESAAPASTVTQPVQLVIRPAVTPAELRAAAYLRAASFYTYPTDRSEWAARSHRRMKADAEWEALTAKVEGADPAYKQVVVTPFIACIPDDPDCPVAQQVSSQMFDRSTKLPGDSMAGALAEDQDAAGSWLVVATLDLNQGRNLPAEELQGKWPQAGPAAEQQPPQQQQAEQGVCMGDPARQRAYLSNVCVDTAMRRQGVAHRLIRAVEDAAAAQGVTHMYVHVVHDNTPAVRLYQQALGYAVESEDSESFARAAARPKRLLLCKQLVQ